MADVQEERAGRDSWEPGIRHAFKRARIIGKGEEPGASGEHGTASRYEIQGELARDTLSVLLLAHDREVDRDVTLRLLHGDSDGNGDVSSVQRFLSEAQVGAQLQHPGILPVYGLGLLDDGRAYVASRIVEGMPLAHLMDRGANPDRLLGVLEQAAQALAYAHARGVAHGALDAMRIHVGAHGEVVISGWESAVRANRDKDPVDADVDALLGLLEQAFGRSIKQQPKSSAGIARAIGRHLAGRESRVREAEIAAATARVKSEQEKTRVLRSKRRALRERAARQRTLALAAAGILIALLGLGGFLFREGEEAAEQDRLGAQVATALREAKRHEAAGEFSDARAFASKAAALVSGVDESIHQELPTLVERLDQRIRMQARGRALRTRLREIEALRGVETPDRITDEYDSAFRRAGLDLLNMDPDEAAEAIRAWPEHLEIVFVLMSWSLEVSWGSMGRKSDRTHLMSIVKLVDPDPWGLADRRGGSDGEVRRLIESMDIAKLRPGSIRRLAMEAAGLGEPAQADAIYREALLRHPSDFDLGAEGSSWMTQRDSADAVGHARVVLALRPADLASSHNLGFVLMTRGGREEAQLHFRRAIDVRPDLYQAHHNLAVALMQAGEIDKALQSVRRAIDLDQCAAASYLTLGNLLSRRKDYRGAEQAWRRALELDPRNREARSQLSWVLALHLEQPEKAVQLVREASRQEPGNALLLVDLGTVLGDTGNWQEAEAVCRRALVLDPELSRGYHLLGAVHAVAGDYQEAIQEFERATELDPGNRTAWSLLGTAHANTGALPGALEAFRKAVALDAGIAFDQTELGATLQKLGRYEEAAEAFRRALKLDPKRYRAHNILGAILCDRLDDPEGAVTHFKAAIALRPEDPAYHANLGNALIGCGKHAEAALAYRQAISLDDASVFGRANLAWVLATAPDERDRDPEEALALAEQADRLAPNLPNTWATLGIVQYQLGNYEKALERLARIRGVIASHQLITEGFFLAMTCHRLGRLEEAREWFERSSGWIDENKRHNDEFKRFQAEAEALLSKE